jgi:hypothetical protein
LGAMPAQTLARVTGTVVDDDVQREAGRKVKAARSSHSQASQLNQRLARHGKLPASTARTAHGVVTVIICADTGTLRYGRWGTRY